MADDDQRLREIQAEYLDFLDDEVDCDFRFFVCTTKPLMPKFLCFTGRSRYLCWSCQGHDRRKQQTIDCEHQRSEAEESHSWPSAPDRHVWWAAGLLQSAEGLCGVGSAELRQGERGVLCRIRRLLWKSSCNTKIFDFKVRTSALKAMENKNVEL